MRINVEHTINDLARDAARIPPKAAKRMATVTKRNVRQGNTEARRIARAASGIHGLNYFKRITWEMTSPLSGEYGPTGDVVGNAVGAGYRNGPPNTDLEKSLDIQGPKFAKDAGDTLDGLFW